MARAETEPRLAAPGRRRRLSGALAQRLSTVLDRLQWLLTRTGTRLSTPTLALLAALGILAIAVVLSLELSRGGYGRKIAAATAMREDIALIREAREARQLPINEDEDANGTGLVGLYTSPITTDRGSLRQKLTVTNPGVAAAVVDLLDRAHIGPDDVVAVAMTGSLPGLSIAVLEALEQRGAETLEIASVGASNWGANEPQFTWLDMQSVLIGADRIRPRLLGASLGGGDDNGKTMTRRGREEAMTAVVRNGVPLIAPPTLQEAAAERLRRYQEAAGGRPIKLYINIGGGVSSLGPANQPQLLGTGINSHLPRGAEHSIGVAYDYLRQGTPVLQLRDVQTLARHYGLPAAPTPLPVIGRGPVYQDRGLQTAAAAVALALLSGAVVLARLGLCERLWSRLGRMRAIRASRQTPA